MASTSPAKPGDDMDEDIALLIQLLAGDGITARVIEHTAVYTTLHLTVAETPEQTMTITCVRAALVIEDQHAAFPFPFPSGVFPLRGEWRKRNNN